MMYSPVTVASDQSLLGVENAVALTEAQEGLWYAQRLDPTNPIFNTAHCSDLQGSLALAPLTDAINQTLAEADALSLRFIDAPSGPKQYFDPAHQPRVELVDLRQHPYAIETALATMQEDQRTALDPTCQALSKQVLFLISDTHYQWYQRVHHLAADGYGMALIEQRALQLYEHLTSHAPAGQPLLSFAAVVADDQNYRNSEKRAQDAAFWQQQLAHIEDVESLSKTVALSAHTFLRAQRSIDAHTQHLLQKAQERFGCSWADILTILSAAYIQRHTSNEEVVVGVPYMGRMGNCSARSIATVMNIAPIPLRINQRCTVKELVQAGSAALLKSRRHSRYRSEQLRRDLGFLAGLRRLHGPLINILPFDGRGQLPGIVCKQQVLCAGPVEDLNFNFRSAPDGSNLRLEIEANPRLYSADDVTQHLARFANFLNNALRAHRLSAVPSLTPDEYLTWVINTNRTEHPVPKCSLPALIHTQSQKFAANTALEYVGSDALTYQQFIKAVHNAAQHLANVGVKRGDIVAVMLERSPEMLITLHAIMSAGAAYLPLDVQQPHDRLTRILKNATPKLLIQAEAHSSLSLAPDTSVMAVDRLFATEAELIYDIQSPKYFDPAYVLYTSGSTGDPKGVVVSHQAIVNRLLWMQQHYQLDAQHRFLQKTPYTFDVSLWELFLPMLCGASLTIAAPELHKDPYALAQLIREQNISVLHFVPSMLAAFLNEPLSNGLAIPLVFCSGEALTAHLCQRFYQHITGQLHNLYGPTEAAVDVSYWAIQPDHIDDPVPIGLPVWNTQLYVLDDFRRPVPPGVTGQLYLGGIQLAEGYLGRPDLSAKQFVLSPFSSNDDVLLYDTGDLASYRSDGAVLYQGRVDHQIKLRGQRIELGEIESCLSKAPGVHELAIIARHDANNDLYIAAYLVPHDAEHADTDAVALYARNNLPEAMVPSAFIWLDALPINANGKLDRRALPEPQRQRKEGSSLQGDTQHHIATLYAKVLNLDTPPFADDDFFALGGHSLLAAQLAADLRHNYTIELSLGALFEHTTVERLAAYIDTLRQSNSSDRHAGFKNTFVLRQGSANSLETPLFCIHPAGGLSWCYGLLARELSGNRPIIGLQSSSLLADADTPESLHAMAEHYANLIQAHTPHGPYHLLGWSVGGIIAHEVALILQDRGASLGVVAMLDAYPSDAWRDQAAPAPEAGYKALLYIAGYDPDTLPHVELSPQGVIQFLRESGHALGELSDKHLQGVLHSVELNNRFVREHYHRYLDHSVLYFRAALDHQNDILEAEMWQPWVQQLQLHQVPALHAHLTNADAMQHILPVLERALNKIPSDTTPCN